MKELNDIILAYGKAVIENKQTALATVVRVEGSSYRRPGARMLVTEDGDITGAISGGCLEGDALRKAQLAMHLQQNKLEIYDTTDDEDNKLGVQLGCNGIVYILFEPIKQEDKNNPVELLKSIAQKRKGAVLVTVFNNNKSAEQKGTCCLVSNEKTVAHGITQTLIDESKNVLQQKTSVILKQENNAVLYQFVPPVIQLVIVGAGNDAQPLVDMAFILGWNIVVVDGRRAHATQQRFAKAGKVCIVKPTEILSEIDVDEQTAVVLMTHNYNYDIAALEQFIATDCNYIGVLGPKKKLHKMFDELHEKGVTITDEKMQKIYGPVGLDVGAETSEEIALSIIAEIKAVFAQHNGSPLKEKTTSIHTRHTTLHHE